MLRGTMTPDPNTEADLLAAKLLKMIEDAHPDAVVVTTGQTIRTKRRRRFAPDDLVRIVTAGDNEVCKACQEIANGGPYRYADVKKTIPHHPFCRCAIAPLRVNDPGWLYQHPRASIKQFSRVFHSHITPKARPVVRKTSRRNAAIIGLLKKKRKFVAPRGKRSMKIYKMNRKNKRR
jgi:hypothetical protein